MRSSDAGLHELKRVTAGFNVSFVFSVWDRISRKIDGPLNVHQLPRIFDENVCLVLPQEWYGHLNLWQALAPLHDRLARLNEEPRPGKIAEVICAHFPDAVVDIEPSDLLDLEFNEPLEDKNSMRMTYKFWRANQIKRKLERTHGKFDVVLRSRADVLLGGLSLAYVAEQAKQGHLLIENWIPERPWASDNFAAGTSADIDTYCAVFGRAIDLPRTWRHIHVDLFKQVQHLSEINYVPITGWADDELVSLQQCLDCLREMREHSHAAWTPTHEVALASFEAMELVLSGRGAEALERVGAAMAAAHEGAPGRESLLFAAAAAFRSLGSALQAFACVFTALAPLPVDGLIDSRRTLVNQILCDILACGLGEENLLDVNRVAGMVAAAPAPPWLAAALSTLTEPGRVESWIENQLGALLESIDPKAMLNRGEVGLLSQLFDTLVALNKANNKPSLDVYFNVAAAHMSLHRHAEAIKILKAAAADFSDSVHVKYMLADALKLNGDYADARFWQELAIAENPSHGGAQRQMAELSLFLGSYDDALRHAHLAFQLEASDAHRLLLGFVMFENGDRKGAVSECRQLPEGFETPESFLRIPGFSVFAKEVELERCP